MACANENRPHSNSSQFFITLEKCEQLNRKNTIFGNITGESIYNLANLNSLEVVPTSVSAQRLTQCDQLLATLPLQISFCYPKSIFRQRLRAHQFLKALRPDCQLAKYQAGGHIEDMRRSVLDLLLSQSDICVSSHAMHLGTGTICRHLGRE